MKKSRFTGLLTILTVILLAVIFSTSATAVRYLGDVNGNGRVDSGDARLALRCSLRLEDLKDEEFKLADVTGDGKVLSSDARIILRMSLRLEEQITIPESTDKPVDPPSTNPHIPSTDTPIPPTVPPVSSEVPPEESTSEVPPEESTSEVPPEESTSEVPPEEPTSEVPPEEPTEPEIGETVVDQQCYVDAVVRTYDKDGNAEVQSIQSAYEVKTEKGLSKKVTVTNIFVRSGTLFPGHDIGMLVKESATKLSNKPVQDLYLINYDTNEYMCIDHSVSDMMGSSEDMGVTTETAITIITFKSLEGWNAETEVIDGTTYSVVTVKNADGTTNKYYLVQKDGRDFYEPEIIELYNTDGNIASSMLIRKYDPDPSSYVEVPKMKGFKITAANMLTKLDAMVDFMGKIGMA